MVRDRENDQGRRRGSVSHVFTNRRGTFAGSRSAPKPSTSGTDGCGGCRDGTAGTYPLSQSLLKGGSPTVDQKPVARISESSSVGARPSSAAPVEQNPLILNETENRLAHS